MARIPRIRKDISIRLNKPIQIMGKKILQRNSASNSRNSARKMPLYQPKPSPQGEGALRLGFIAEFCGFL